MNDASGPKLIDKSGDSIEEGNVLSRSEQGESVHDREVLSPTRCQDSSISQTSSGADTGAGVTPPSPIQTATSSISETSEMQHKSRYKYDGRQIKQPINPKVSNRRDNTNSAMKDEIFNWLASVGEWKDTHQLGSKYRSYLPVRSGTKPIDPHSLLKTILNDTRYKGEVDSHNRKPNGNGEMMFSNGDWYCGQFQAGININEYLRIYDHFIEWFKTWSRSHEIEH